MYSCSLLCFNLVGDTERPFCTSFNSWLLSWNRFLIKYIAKPNSQDSPLTPFKSKHQEPSPRQHSAWRLADADASSRFAWEGSAQDEVARWQVCDRWVLRAEVILYTAVDHGPQWTAMDMRGPWMGCFETCRWPCPDDRTQIICIIMRERDRCDLNTEAESCKRQKDKLLS